MAGLNVRGDLVGNVQDDLNAAASPMALDPAPRRRASPYETELRIKRLAQQAGVSRQEARRLYEEGLADAEVDPEVGMTPAQLSMATQSLRDMAGTRQDEAEANRKKKWAAMTYLAGGAQNLGGGNRAMYAALADLPEEERQKSLQYMMPGGNQAAAVDVAEVRGNPEMDARILAIETQNQAAADARAQQDRQFRAEMDERGAARAEDAATREAAAQRHMEEIRWANEMALEKMRNESQNSAQEWDRRFDMAKLPIDAELAAAKAKQETFDKQLAANKEAEARALPGGEGTYQLQQGNYNHPLAEELMKQKARESDKSCLGFYPDDANRLHATLIGLGIKDPAVRQMLVAKYGQQRSWSRGGTPAY